MQIKDIILESHWPAKNFVDDIEKNNSKILNFVYLEPGTLRLVDIKFKSVFYGETLIYIINILQKLAQQQNITLSVNETDKNTIYQLKKLGFEYPMTDYSDLVWIPK